MNTESNSKALTDLITGVCVDAAQEGVIPRALQAIRSHLGMEVAYVSEFVDGRSVFREVDAPGLEALIKVGDSHSLDDVYCRHILEGRLPELMPDTAAEPLAWAMPVTKAASIGKHMSVPIRLPDGRPYGMFCCLGSKADHSLTQRDLQMMRVFAELAAFEITRDLGAAQANEQRCAEIKDVIDAHRFSIVYQPIWDAKTLRPVGLECLTRFAATPPRSPDKWFNDASSVGLGVELEIAAIRSALLAIPSCPEDLYVAVNASPDVVLSGKLEQVFPVALRERIVLEITEHAPVEDYDLLREALLPLRRDGVRLAVDDAGAGHSSLAHILQLSPDLIKLDMGLTRGVDLDPARRALASAMVLFAREIGSKIIAEGVETASELSALRALGIDAAQGYLLGRPMPFGQLGSLTLPAHDMERRSA